jgi:hypothetical protein
MPDRSLLTARVTAIITEQHFCTPELVHQTVEETLFQLLRLAREGDPVDLDYLGRIVRDDADRFVWTVPEEDAA